MNIPLMAPYSFKNLGDDLAELVVIFSTNVREMSSTISHSMIKPGDVLSPLLIHSPGCKTKGRGTK